MFGANIDPETVFGLALVNDQHLPVALGGAFWEDDQCHIFLHLGKDGKFFKANPTRILKAMKQIKSALLDIGVTDLYLEADLRVPKSKDLIEWAGGQPTGQDGQLGPIYSLNLLEFKKI